MKNTNTYYVKIYLFGTLQILMFTAETLLKLQMSLRMFSYHENVVSISMLQDEASVEVYSNSDFMDFLGEVNTSICKEEIAEMEESNEIKS